MDIHDIDQMKSVVSDALAHAKKSGASSAEADLSASAGLSVNVRLDEVETIEHNRDRGLSVTVYLGHRKGSASTSDLTATAVRETVEAACGIARYTAEDEFSGLADAELMATDFPNLDLLHPWALSAEEAAEIARRTEAAARDVDARITNSEGASVSWSEGSGVYGNSHGFLQGVSGSRHGSSVVVIAEHEGAMERDYWYTSSRRASDLEAPESVGAKAGARTIARLGAKKLSTREVPVMFAAEIAGGVLRHFTSAVSGGNQFRKTTFLLDAAGEQVFSDWVRIHEQPHLTMAAGSGSFDGEGVATRARDIVSGGVLQGYVLGSYSARKLGLATTGNAGGTRNLTIDPSPAALDFDGMLKEMGTGLLVTELMGMGVKIATGDYSRGAGGYWVENGEITHPVDEFTIAGNLKDMFKGLVHAGTDYDLRGNTRSGSLMIDKMTIAG